MNPFDRDPLLRRVERGTLMTCVAMALAAWGVRAGNPDVAVGVIGGGALIALSYSTLRASVTTLVRLVSEASADAAARATVQPAEDAGATGGEPSADRLARRLRRRRGAFLLVRLASRYALLSLIAYAMIARLRMHPVGLLLGVSSFFVAVSYEAVRVAASADRQRPRA
jgi:hypothetical protein